MEQEHRIVQAVTEEKTEKVKAADYEKKSCRMQQIMTGAVVGIFLIVLYCAITIVPRLNASLDRADKIMTDMEQISSELTEADLPGMLEDMDAFISDSGNGIGDALKKINAIDLEGLNEAINDLQSVVRPLSKLFGN